MTLRPDLHALYHAPKAGRAISQCPKKEDAADHLASSSQSKSIRPELDFWWRGGNNIAYKRLSSPSTLGMNPAPIHPGRKLR
jgi:hypothetical protein